MRQAGKVSYCATCDGAFYRDKHVAVIGGGNSAGEESLFLTRFAKDVTIITRDPALTASQVVVQKLSEHEDISVVTGVEPVGFATEDGRLVGVQVEDSGVRRTIPADGVFVFIGLTPNSQLVAELVDLDPQGFVVSDVGMQTSVPGLFVAGDVRSTSTKQAASAAGEGAAAALAIRRYVDPLASGLRAMDAEKAPA
jgi:thioredoxin reductase (NADPH)